MYAEVALWQLLTSMTSKLKVHQYVGGTESTKSKYRDGKVFEALTLTNRPVVADTLNGILNYQDQGTAAEIALYAMALLRKGATLSRGAVDYTQYLVNFVHDELVFDCPEELCDDAVVAIESAMRQSAHELVGSQYDISFDVETEAGDCWIH
jgi:DNA polymerase-1